MVYRRIYRSARSFLRSKNGRRVKTGASLVGTALALRYAPQLAPFIARRSFKPLVRRYVASRVRAYTTNPSELSYRNYDPVALRRWKHLRQIKDFEKFTLKSSRR